MEEEIKRRIAEGESGLERLIRAIPGYRGYKEKELRRQADKLLRSHLARQFEAQRRRLGEVQVRLTNTGRLASIVTLERGMMKLQLLIDRLKTASYGYAGWFDAVKVEERELDALYVFDSAMAGSVAQVEGLIDALAEAAAREEETGTAGNELLDAVEEINATFTKRQDAIIGLD